MHVTKRQLGWVPDACCATLLHQVSDQLLLTKALRGLALMGATSIKARLCTACVFGRPTILWQHPANDPCCLAQWFPLLRG